MELCPECAELCGESVEFCREFKCSDQNVWSSVENKSALLRMYGAL